MVVESASGRQGPEISIERVVELLTGPNSEDLQARHVVTIEQLCRTNARGFAIRDLGKINTVLTITIKAVKGRHGFEASLCLLLRTLGKPLVRKSSTDEMKMGSWIRDMLATVATIFCEEVPTGVQLCACESARLDVLQMLKDFSSGYGNRPPCLDMENALKNPDSDSGPRRYYENQRLVEKSGAISLVVSALSNTQDLNLVCAYMDVLLHFSYHAGNATQLVETTSILLLIPSVLEACDATLRSPLVPIVTDLLWNVVDTMPSPCVLPLVGPTELPEQPSPMSQMSLPRHVPRPSAASSVASLRLRHSTTVVGSSMRASGRPSFNPILKLSTRRRSLQNGVLQGLDSITDGGAEEGSEDFLSEAEGRAHASLVMDKIAANPEACVGPEFREAVLARKSDHNLVSYLTMKSDTASAAVNSALASLEGQRSRRQSSDGDEGSLKVSPAIAQYVHRDLFEDFENDEVEDTGGLDCAYAEIFKSLIQESCSTTFDDISKETRNSLLAVLSYLVQSKRFCAALHECKAHELLGQLAATPDLQPPDNVTIRFQAVAYDALDHEMRRLLWNILTTMCESSGACRDAIMQLGFMQLLLLYVDLEKMQSQAIFRWNPAELTALRRLALSSLFRLAPTCTAQFESCGGPRILLRFIQECDELPHVEFTLRVLNTLAISVPSQRLLLGTHDALRIVRSRFELRSLPQELRLQALLSIHSLCSECPPNVVVFEAEGFVEVIAQELMLTRDADPVLPNDFCMELVAITWTVIATSPTGLRRFLQAEGMDALLDHLERGNGGLQPLILSVIADILKASPVAHAYWREWRSQLSQTTATQLLLALWREIESDKGIRKDGLLTNDQRPLEGSGKRCLWIPKHEVQYGFLNQDFKKELRMIYNAVSADMRMRKVYSVLNLIGFASQMDGLDARDGATLTFVEKYIKFKQGEVWADMATHFRANGIKPTAPDRERLLSGIEFAQYLATIVVKEQQMIIDGERTREEAKEKQFYQEKTQQALQEYQAKFYKKDKSQVSAKEKQEARLRKEAMLAASMEMTHGELRKQSDVLEDTAQPV